MLNTSFLKAGDIMNTVKLYDLDSSVCCFTSEIVEIKEENGLAAIVTKQTAFFPEGGGQSSDIGTLGEFDIFDVQTKDGVITHYSQQTDKLSSVNVGDEISGRVDMKKRFSDMQQHSGEHIFSGVVNSLFGYDNVGFHLGNDYVTVDYNGTLNKEDVLKIEELSNKAVFENKEIRVFYPTDEEAAKLNYRSKKEIKDGLRLVEIEGVDLCACCAPHVKYTGEIGLIEVVSFERYKGGTRLQILCGERALKDVRAKLDENHKVSNLLSSRETETSAAVEKLKNDLAQTSFELVGAKIELAEFMAKSIQPQKRIIEFCRETDMDYLRRYCDILSQKAEEFAAVFSSGEEKRFVIITKTDFDLQQTAKQFREKLGAKGGGRNGIIQGSVSASEEEILNALR